MMNWLNRHLIYQLLNAKLKNNEAIEKDEALFKAFISWKENNSLIYACKHNV